MTTGYDRISEIAQEGGLRHLTPEVVSGKFNPNLFHKSVLDFLNYLEENLSNYSEHENELGTIMYTLEDTVC